MRPSAKTKHSFDHKILREEFMSHYRNNFRHYYDNHRDYRYHDTHYSFEHKIKNYFLRELKGGKKLLLVLLTAIVVIFIVTVLLFIILAPLITKIIEFISTNGIKGVVDLVNQFLERLWAGKGQII